MNSFYPSYARFLGTKLFKDELRRVLAEQVYDLLASGIVGLEVQCQHQVEGGDTIIVFDIHIHAGLEKKAGDVDVALSTRPVEGGPVIVVLRGCIRQFSIRE